MEKIFDHPEEGKIVSMIYFEGRAFVACERGVWELWPVPTEQKPGDAPRTPEYRHDDFYEKHYEVQKAVLHSLAEQPEKPTKAANLSFSEALEAIRDKKTVKQGMDWRRYRLNDHGELAVYNANGLHIETLRDSIPMTMLTNDWQIVEDNA